jgi:hypothetical protein
MAKRRKRAIFAVGNDGVLCVELTAVMHPLCALFDGLTLVFFGKSKKAYMRVVDAIAWCRKESKHYDAEKYRLMIEVMERALTENAPQ